MKKVTEILVPVDFSQPSANALRYALRLADKIEATIDIVHVIPSQADGLDYPVLVAQATQVRVDAARINLKKFVDTGLTSTGPYLKTAPMISADIEIGTPVEVISEVADKEGSRLIVMGSRGNKRSGFEKMLGSVAAGVIKKAKCPVIVVPEEETFSSFEKITYATDIKDADPFAIWNALELLKPYTPAVEIVHINLKKEGDREAWAKMEKMKTFFEGRTENVNVDFYHIPGKKVEEELNEFIEIHPSDLLVMYQPQYDFWNRLFHKSVTKKMAMYTKIPLLVLKA